MKFLMLFVLILSVNGASAKGTGSKGKRSVEPKSTAKTTEIKDPVWGKIFLKIETDGEPVFNPDKLTVSLLCNDQRTKKNAVTPKEEILIDSDAICEFKGHEYDEKRKQLTIFFMTSEPAEGEAECNSPWTQSFDFKDLCSEWKN